MSDEIEYVRGVVEAATGGPWEARNYRSYPQEEWGVAEALDMPPLIDDAIAREEDARAIALLGSTAAEALAVIEAAVEWENVETAEDETAASYSLLTAMNAWREAVRQHRERGGE